MQHDEASSPDPSIGLCASCGHRRTQASRRGSVFHRCARADSDERYPRYPALPVLRCRGHEPAKSGAPQGSSDLNRA